MIRYDPKAMLKRLAPAAKVKKLLRGNVTLKKTALSFVDGADFLDKKKVAETALKVVRSYQERIAREQAEAGLEKAAGDAIEKEILSDPKLLIQRVENEVVWQVSQAIKEEYNGESYEWLPSDAEEPDPEHQLNYGKVFIIGDGEQPGDRYGCRCGMNILVKGSKLQLG